jgi:hypothetical protein
MSLLIQMFLHTMNKKEPNPFCFPIIMIRYIKNGMKGEWVVGRNHNPTIVIEKSKRILKNNN